MELTGYIGIESFNHFNDEIYKKIIINRLLDAEDLTNILKDFIFMRKEEVEFKNKNKQVLFSIKCADVSTRRNNHIDETWAFCTNYEDIRAPRFQATNCKFCGEYINTATIEFFCAQSAKCNCIIIHMYDNVYFNLTRNTYYRIE